MHNFQDVHAFLSKRIRPATSSEEYKLDAIKAFLSFAGNPQDAYKTIHIAGTSGKTSTAYYTAALLKEHGYRVGLTVSPHIDQINERVQINMQSLAEAEYVKYFNQFLVLVESYDQPLSYFETLISFAYWVFASKQVDYAVVEVGLGGLLDGTNVITRSDKVAVITDIGLDHTEILGDTIEQIAMQKAGIILPGNHVFMHQQPKSIMQNVQTVTDTKSAQLSVISSMDAPQMDELSSFQRRNMELALEVVSYIRHRDHNAVIDDTARRQASQIIIPARMEVSAYKNHKIIMDGSHNQQKVAALASAISEQYGNQSIHLIVSFGENKRVDAAAILSELLMISLAITFTAFKAYQDQIRTAIDPYELAKIAREVGFTNISVVDDPIEAFEHLVESSDKTVLITGSYFLLNHLRPVIISNS